MNQCKNRMLAKIKINYLLPPALLLRNFMEYRTFFFSDGLVDSFANSYFLQWEKRLKDEVPSIKKKKIKIELWLESKSKCNYSLDYVCVWLKGFKISQSHINFSFPWSCVYTLSQTCLQALFEFHLWNINLWSPSDYPISRDFSEWRMCYALQLTSILVTWSGKKQTQNIILFWSS